MIVATGRTSRKRNALSKSAVFTRTGGGGGGRLGGAVLGLVLLRVLLEDLRLGGVGRHPQNLCMVDW